LAALGSIGLADLLPRMPVFWQHARQIAAALRDVPEIRVVPDPPQVMIDGARSLRMRTAIWAGTPASSRVSWAGW
jgi:hypothetical protein